MELTPQQFQQEVKAGKLRPAYYLVGEDPAARAAAVLSLKEKFGTDAFNVSELPAEGADEAVSTALTPPVFAERRLVILRDPRLTAETRKALAAYLTDPLETTTLVLHSEDRKPDLRDVLTAAAAALGGVVVFRPLSEDEAVRKLTQTAREAGLALDPDAARWIVEEVGVHWGLLRGELEKIILYAKGRKEISQEDALACLGYRQTSNPFDFPRLLQSRAPKKCLELLRRLMAEGTDEFRLLYQITGTLNKQLKGKRLQAAGVPEPSIFGQLRLSPYYDKDFLRKAAMVSEARLARDLKACLDFETNLKSKSWLEPRIELERLVAGLCERTAAKVG